MTEIGEALWRFSLALYARPGVAEALIALQDRAHCDANVILFALWAGAIHGVQLAPATLAAAEAASAGLRHEVVKPLRGLRRMMKAEPGEDMQALRRKILTLELAAERRVQQRLAASLEPNGRNEPHRLSAAEANLAQYLGDEALSPEAALVRAALTVLTRED